MAYKDLGSTYTCDLCATTQVSPTNGLPTDWSMGKFEIEWGYSYSQRLHICDGCFSVPKKPIRESNIRKLFQKIFCKPSISGEVKQQIAQQTLADQAMKGEK
jgi:hypothetical protein